MRFPAHITFVSTDMQPPRGWASDPAGTRQAGADRARLRQTLNLRHLFTDIPTSERIAGPDVAVFPFEVPPTSCPGGTHCQYDGGALQRRAALPIAPRSRFRSLLAPLFAARAGGCPPDSDPLSPPPFRWDEDRRFLLRCELDAAFFHLYLPSDPNGGWKPARKTDGCPHDETPEQLAELKKHFPAPRDAVAYVMDAFPIVRRREEKWGEYRTKRVILEIYDAMLESARAGAPYQTRLDPPPADPRCCHPAREKP